MLHFGTHHYGKVDQVPGLFHVKTKFFHVHFLPLIPLGSYLLFENTAEGNDGIAIGWSWKSIFFAWLRVTLFLVGAILAVLALLGMVMLLEDNEHLEAVLVTFFGALGVFALLYFSFRWTHARPYRALCLARQAGLEPEELAEFFVHHPALAELEDQRVNGELSG
jgi:hypothetical protein